MKKKNILAAIGFAITLTSCTNNSSDMQDMYFMNIEKALQKYELCEAQNKLYSLSYNEIVLEIKILESNLSLEEANNLRKRNEENLSCKYARKAVEYKEYLDSSEFKTGQKMLEKVFQAETQINKRAIELNKQYQNSTLKEVVESLFAEYDEKQCAVKPREEGFNFENYVDCEAMMQVLVERIPNEMNKMREKTLTELLKLEPKVCNHLIKGENVIRLTDRVVFIPDCMALTRVVEEKVKNKSLPELFKIAGETHPYRNEPLNRGSFFAISDILDNRANYSSNSYLLNYKKLKSAYLKCVAEAKSAVKNSGGIVYVKDVQDVMNKISYECDYLNDTFPILGFSSITHLAVNLIDLRRLNNKMGE